MPKILKKTNQKRIRIEGSNKYENDESHSHPNHCFMRYTLVAVGSGKLTSTFSELI